MMLHFYNVFESLDVNESLSLEFLSRSASVEKNGDLMAPISAEEVHLTLFSMHLDKVAGPDGLNPTFYQHFW